MRTFVEITGEEAKATWKVSQLNTHKLGTSATESHSHLRSTEQETKADVTQEREFECPGCFLEWTPYQENQGGRNNSELTQHST